MLKHVANMSACEQAMRTLLWASLFIPLPYALLSVVFLALNFGELKRFHESFYQNLRKLSLFILYVNEDGSELPWLWEQL